MKNRLSPKRADQAGHGDDSQHLNRQFAPRRRDAASAMSNTAQPRYTSVPAVMERETRPITPAGSILRASSAR